jgi:uncharacterized membrane protein
MPISKLILSYALTAVVFFAIDLLWLGIAARGTYQKYLGHLLAEQVNWTAAIIFYLLFIVGIFIFAIMPAVAKESITQALILGALFGFFTYATYDLTNLATLKDWPLGIVFIDMAWGAVLTAIVSMSGYAIVTWLKG